MKRVIILCIALAISNNICFASSAYLPPLQPIKVQSQSNTNNDTKSYSPTPQENYNPSETNSDDSDYNENENLQSNQDSQVNPDQKLSNIAPLAPDSNVNYPKIDEIEKLIYGKTYTKQGLNVRLARIEKSLFKQTYDNLSLSQRVDKIVMNFDGGNTQVSSSSKISDKELSKMEQKVFGRNFSNANADERLSHLEQHVFGASQSGDDLSRYNRLSAAIRRQPQPGNFDEQLAGMQPKRGIRGFFSNLGQIISGGTMTGFTPSIDTMDLGGMDDGGGYSSYNSYNGYYPSRSYYPSYNTLNTGYNPYNPYYYNQAQRYNGMNGQSGIYRGVRTNTGYSDRFRSFGNGCGVTILD